MYPIFNVPWMKERANMRNQTARLGVYLFVVCLSQCEQSAVAQTSDAREGAAKELSLAGAAFTVDTAAAQKIYLGLSCTRNTRMDLVAKHLHQFKDLRFVHFNDTAISAQHLQALNKLAKLSRLGIYNCTLPDEGPKIIAEHKGLAQVALSGTKIGDAGFRELIRLPNLQSLTVLDSSITDASAKVLSKHMKIKQMSIGPSITDVGMAELGKLKTLTELSMVGAQISGKGLKALSPLNGLISLNLTKYKISDQDIKEVVTLRTLWGLNLSGTELTDAALASLPGLENLRTLSLANTKVTNGGILQLRAMPKLSELDLSGTRVDKKGADAFRKLRPKISIGFQ